MIFKDGAFRQTCPNNVSMRRMLAASIASWFELPGLQIITKLLYDARIQQSKQTVGPMPEKRNLSSKAKLMSLRTQRCKSQTI